ncbi:Uncharacterized protein SCF082_LOCUS47750 [Durusdinium trenchii]|uniref:Myb-like domain-containing protein n=1 Tax=Durusdinium trenchii TaxID=1381693 RepID=A0ABP0RPW3_9DINO
MPTKHPSTPPRTRMRAKTATSASRDKRPSALRNSSSQNLKAFLDDKKRKREAKAFEAMAKSDKEDKDQKQTENKREKKECTKKNQKDEKKAEKRDEKKPEKIEKSEKRDEKKPERIEKPEKKSEKSAEKKAEKSEVKKPEKVDGKSDAKSSEKRDEKKDKKEKKASEKKEKKREKSEKKEKEKAENKKKDKKKKDEKKPNKVEKKVEEQETEVESDVVRSKSKKIKYVPCKKRKIEHIFDSPGSGSGLSAKEKAEMRLQELQDTLEASDEDDSSSSCPATDLEAQLLLESEADETDSEASSDVGSGDESDHGQSAESEEEDEGGSSDTTAGDDDQDADDDDEESSEEGEADPKATGKEDETTGDAKGEASEEHALVPVTNQTKCTTLALRNSVTHKREWDTFCRQARTKMPFNLSEYFTTAKNDLFNMWVDAGCNWSKCALEVERRQAEKNISKRAWKAVQGKELKKRYSEEKWTKVKDARKSQGLFYWDEDFPEDEEASCEAWYFVREGNEFVRKEETSEAMTLKGKRDVDPALREAITSKEDGIMPVGALPKMEGISSQGSKSLMEAMAKVAPAPKRKPKEQQSEPVEPLTTEGRAKALLQDMLKDVEGYYKKLSQAVNEKDEEVLKGLLDRICGIMTGGAKAQAAAAAFLKPGKQKKPKKNSGGKKVKTKAKK